MLNVVTLGGYKIAFDLDLSKVILSSDSSANNCASTGSCEQQQVVRACCGDSWESRGSVPTRAGGHYYL